MCSTNSHQHTLNGQRLSDFIHPLAVAVITHAVHSVIIHTHLRVEDYFLYRGKILSAIGIMKLLAAISKLSVLAAEVHQVLGLLSERDAKERRSLVFYTLKTFNLFA